MKVLGQMADGTLVIDGEWETVGHNVGLTDVVITRFHFDRTKSLPVIDRRKGEWIIDGLPEETE